MKQTFRLKHGWALASGLLMAPLACGTAGGPTQEQGESTATITQALEADPDCEASVYEAEDMDHSTGGPTAGGWNIWSNGYISTTHAFEGGTTTLTAVVRGQSAGGAPPNMQITVGGQVVHSTAVGSTSWTEYNFTFEAPGGEQEIRIYFTNDYYQNGQDRNLYVDKLIVGCGVGVCMNGTVDPGEECDDGSQTSNDSCKTDCTWNVCGDGVLYDLVTDPNSPNTAEECDDGNNDDGDGCAADCTIEEPSTCGDGTVDDGEECDDGNNDDGDGCAADCTVEAADPVCGDGNVDDGEECDDGNTDDGDGCAADCTVEVSEPVCGDGVLEGAEECDDGNTDDGDGCSSACEIEVAEPACGDGNVDDGEECDDGNTDDGDGCSSTCEVEDGGSVTAEIDVWNDWGSGYCASLVVSNGAEDPTTSWSAVVDYGGGTSFTQWSANFSGNSGEVSMSSLSWNGAIASGGSNASVGFCINRPSGADYASVVSIEASY